MEWEVSVCVWGGKEFSGNPANPSLESRAKQFLYRKAKLGDSSCEWLCL